MDLMPWVLGMAAVYVAAPYIGGKLSDWQDRRSKRRYEAKLAERFSRERKQVPICDRRFIRRSGETVPCTKALGHDGHHANHAKRYLWDNEEWIARTHLN